MGQRLKDNAWTMTPGYNGLYSTADVQPAVMMGLRDELKKLNALLHCSNFTDIPYKLDRIRLNTTKPKRRRKVTP